MSLRTFFRYFTSKEDLVLGQLRSHLNLAEELFARRSAAEPLLASLHAVIEQAVADYATDPDRELIRLRLVAGTPALQGGLAAVFAGFEQLVRRVAAAAVAAFRVGLDMWVASDARLDLSPLVLDNLDDLTIGILAPPIVGADEDARSAQR